MRSREGTGHIEHAVVEPFGMSVKVRGHLKARRGKRAMERLLNPPGADVVGQVEHKRRREIGLSMRLDLGPTRQWSRRATNLEPLVRVVNEEVDVLVPSHAMHRTAFINRWAKTQDVFPALEVKACDVRRAAIIHLQS